MLAGGMFGINANFVVPFWVHNLIERENIIYRLQFFFFGYGSTIILMTHCFRIFHKWVYKFLLVFILANIFFFFLQIVSTYGIRSRTGSLIWETRLYQLNKVLSISYLILTLFYYLPLATYHLFSCESCCDLKRFLFFK